MRCRAIAQLGTVDGGKIGGTNKPSQYIHVRGAANRGSDAVDPLQFLRQLALAGGRKRSQVIGTVNLGLVGGGNIGSAIIPSQYIHVGGAPKGGSGAGGNIQFLRQLALAGGREGTQVC